MAKLEIKLNEEGRRKLESPSMHSLKISDYDILIDGQEPSLITDLTLRMSTEKFNECTISFTTEHIDIDAETLASLELIAEAIQTVINLDTDIDSEQIAKRSITDPGIT
ncbi:hypothetical protein QTN46_02635 [Bacillus amyloliquefaciens]|uniref:hypothetical protein n=1 Tax=Bacillus amyloliquefaciens TaxID=1390 RepID=UPI0025A024DF|nr:hypothetical protein [Bacillus amyloliquefaciens]WJM62584.1 hypothetical protein QTN46_02635 [Bacillus amyloliquefaciens]